MDKGLLYPCLWLRLPSFPGSFLFHSVPIGSDANNDVTIPRQRMFMDKYEMPGVPASDGCIRLTVADANRIYDRSVICDTRAAFAGRPGSVSSTPPAVIGGKPVYG